MKGAEAVVSSKDLPPATFRTTVLMNVTDDPSGPHRPRRHFFDWSASPEEPSGPAENNVPRQLVMSSRLTGDEYEDGLSLRLYYVGPGVGAPRHYHDSDQIIVVLEGELTVGKRRLGPGAGYFTQSGQQYSFKAGPRGCRFLEFRPNTWFNVIPAEGVATSDGGWDDSANDEQLEAETEAAVSTRA
jgi:hypothetical protein